MDPQEEDVATAIHSLSYNQLVETIIDNKNSSDQELVSNLAYNQNDTSLSIENINDTLIIKIIEFQ